MYNHSLTEIPVKQATFVKMDFHFDLIVFLSSIGYKITKCIHLTISMVDVHIHVESINTYREQLICHSTDVNTPFSSTNFNLHLPSGETLSLLLLKGLPQFTQGQCSHEPPSLKHGQRVLMHLGL